MVFRSLGAAFHVLEDYFSHTNFVELSLRKLGYDVYPWVEAKQKITQPQESLYMRIFLLLLGIFVRRYLR